MKSVKYVKCRHKVIKINNSFSNLKSNFQIQRKFECISIHPSITAPSSTAYALALDILTCVLCRERHRRALYIFKYPY